METSLVLLAIVEIGAVKYMMSRQVCKRTEKRNTVIVALCDMQCGLKQELILGVHVISIQLKATCYDRDIMGLSFLSFFTLIKSQPILYFDMSYCIF